MLTEEEVKSIKEQLFKQIESLPEDKKETVRTQIEAMDAKQLEQFLEQNKMMAQGEGGKCIFCSIIDGDTFSYKINENKEAIAVLDINPVSEGHSLVIPKEHKPIEEIPSALQLAQETARKLKSKLNPEDIKMETANVQGHGIINIIPFYKNKKLEKKKASEAELQKLLKKLQEEQAEPKEEPKKKIKLKDLPKAPVRIP